MKRQLIYRDITIETEIIFKYQSERGLNGKSWHKISLNTISDKVCEQFGKSVQVLTTMSKELILDKCETLEQEAKDFLDNFEKTTELEDFFIANGFDKNPVYSRR